MERKLWYSPTALMTGLGQPVEKPADTLPQTGAKALFTISGGRVLLTLIVGEVTTAIQNQADNTQLTYDPDATGATQALCADLDIANDAVGTMYTISGLASDAMRDNLNYARGGLVAAPIVLKPGKILLDCSANNTGAVKWTAWYIALDDGASLVAA